MKAEREMTSNIEDLQVDTNDHAAGKGQRKLAYLPVAALKPAADNPRKHTAAQIRAIAKSIDTFGFTAPILVDKDLNIIAGHGRFEAARLLGLPELPVIFLDHLTEAQALAYRLADNKLTDRSTWDDARVAADLKKLTELVLDFDIESTGFEAPEIDFRLQAFDKIEIIDETTEGLDEFVPVGEKAVSALGDLWLLDGHRLYCGNALENDALACLMGDDQASAAFTDPPYNVPIDGHASGTGSLKFREFAMASGEMSKAEFTRFLTTALSTICTHTASGALLYTCMDWRHMSEMLAAGEATGCELLNLCVWAKSNGGMGSLYRSRHELVFVFKNGQESHQNNVQLGRFGRNRSNVWNYAGANSFGRKTVKNGFGLHPTVKPILLVADAILDSTQRDQIVLDPFIGSGTTILAAQKTGRRCFGVEIDPLYVDTAIERWQRMTGHQATRASDGKSFGALKRSAQS
jgi:DNA modification methylase